MKDNFYNKMLAKTLEMLSDRIIAFIRQDQFDEDTWFRHLGKIYKYMNILEMNKHLKPKFTLSFGKLISYHNKMNVDDKESSSTHTSNSFIKETKREINTLFMKDKSQRVGKHDHKNENKSSGRGASTARNENVSKNMINGNINDLKAKDSKTHTLEENKLEVVETGELANKNVNQPNEIDNTIKTVKTANNPSITNEKGLNDTSVMNDTTNSIKIDPASTGRYYKSGKKHAVGSSKNSFRKFNAHDKYNQMSITDNIGYTHYSTHSGKRHMTQLKIRNKSNKRNGGTTNKRRDNQGRILHSHEREETEELKTNEKERLNETEYVPPIRDPQSKVFTSPGNNILARSKRVKRKKRRLINSQFHGDRVFNMTGMRNAFSGKKIYYK